MAKQDALNAFKENVLIKYQLYNGLFVTLPFANLVEVGAELPVFVEFCREGLAKGKTPVEIVNLFFQNIALEKNFDKQIKTLILLLQFVERQVVLLDALEDAAFTSTHNLLGVGSTGHLLQQLSSENKLTNLIQILQIYRTHIVLTAHPTQFYPPQVLGIIQDLTHAVAHDHIKAVHDLLLQLGKTPFKSQHKPTPLDEADILIHYLKTIFYPVITKLQTKITRTLNIPNLPAVINLGFWPGGDRDGNPNVTAETTLAAAKRLRATIIRIYLHKLDLLKRRLTFRGVIDDLEQLRQQLITALNMPYEKKAKNSINVEIIYAELLKLKQKIINEHQGLFVDKLDSLLHAVNIFGFYFAALDLRQDSRVHGTVIQQLLDYFIKQKQIPEQFASSSQKYAKLTSIEKIDLIMQLLKLAAPKLDDSILQKNALMLDAIESLRAIRTIQAMNGEKGLHRYIISNTQGAHNLFEVLLLAHWAGWSLPTLNLDIIPLFETVADLEHAEAIMQLLYSNKLYQQHLTRRHNQQTVMLGFSDGTKDGGYVTANWEIFKCKTKIAALSKTFAIDVVFFDGRGGPPARGGGNTYQFYRAMGNIIQQKQIQVTIQGQTISSDYGTKASASYNIEQLFAAGIEATLSPNGDNILTKTDYELMEELSQISYSYYQQLKDHPLFLAYLEEITPLEYYSELNIASRPPRRTKKGPLQFSDLRAIPFVGAWSQMKQNVPGFYGLGSALQQLIKAGKEEQLKTLYQHSLFFRALLENAMQTLAKSFFSLTQYLGKDKKFGEFWQLLAHEAELTRNMLKKISQKKELLADHPVEKASIHLREEIVLPLLVIQQYALMMLRQLNKKTDIDSETIKAFHNLVLRSIAANINASRNST